MATITVSGYGEVSVPPDEATVDLSVQAVGSAPAKALAEVAARTRVLVELLDELGIPPAKRFTSGVWVDEEVEPDAEGRRPGFRAGERLTVALVAETVGPLLEAAVSRAQAHVNGPRWVVGAENPARKEALAAAAQDARRRAEALAAGLGLRVGAVVAATEGGAVYPVARTASFGALTEAPPIEAGRSAVSSTVSVTFAVEPA